MVAVSFPIFQMLGPLLLPLSLDKQGRRLQQSLPSRTGLLLTSVAFLLFLDKEGEWFDTLTILSIVEGGEIFERMCLINDGLLSKRKP